MDIRNPDLTGFGMVKNGFVPVSRAARGILVLSLTIEMSCLCPAIILEYFLA